MTSRHCFFRVLREDLRHKIWMLALSTLGSLLTLPVTYLISSGERSQYLRKVPEEAVLRLLWDLACRNESFYGATICCFAGAVAILGALIVGLFGFRYVYQRNMTDLYHSLPVSRKTLFLAGWLNGFLIWFVPYLANLTVTVLMGEYRLSALRRQAEQRGNRSWETWPSGGGLLINALLSTLVILTAFLLVYHLVLLAVMLCGNLLNTLTVTGILGVGSTLAWGITIILRQTYLDTFSERWNAEFQGISHTSPLVSAVCVLYQRVQAFAYGGIYIDRVALGLFAAAVLWLLAYAVYRRRRSELADQGMAGKVLRLVLQAGVSLAAFYGGWLLFWYLGAYGDVLQLVWSIFGGILVGGVVFGALDVIFNMEFKAFFKHKGLLAGVLAAGLLTGLCLRFDWMGYDEYLPEKEEITEIAIYAETLSNRQRYGGSGELANIHIQDPEAAYAFLKSAVSVQKELDRGAARGDISGRGRAVIGETILTKVTLENGRGYYRNYLVYSDCSGPVYELVMKPEYLENCYRISEEAREYFTGIMLRRGSIAYETEKLTREDRQRIDLLCDAYNRDLEENPAAAVRGEGRLLAKIYLDSSQVPLQLAVYEGMSNTREALRQADLGYYADPADPEEVSRIFLSSDLSVRELTAEVNIAEHVRELYGFEVQRDGESEDGSRENSQTSEVENQSGEGLEMPAAEVWESSNPASQTIRDLSVMDGILELEITDPGEIAELLELFSYSTSRAGVLFGSEEMIYGRVRILEKSGNQYDVYIADGALPEKYIARFEQAGREILEQRSR